MSALSFAHNPLEKIDQNYTKTICWKCDGFVMVFSEKPAENHHFSQYHYDGFSKGLVLKTRTFDKPAENYQ